MKTYLILPLSFLLFSCSNKPTHPEKHFTDLYFDSVFNSGYPEVYTLSKDSLLINNLDLVIRFVHVQSSHGTDYLILANRKTRQIHLFPQHRGYFMDYPELSEVLFLLKNSECEISHSALRGLENYLSDCGQIYLSNECLDSILRFHKSEYLGKRLKSETDLNIFLDNSSPFSHKRDEKLTELSSLLHMKLKRKNILMYGRPPGTIIYFEINPGIDPAELQKEQQNQRHSDFYRPFQHNIKRIDIGLKS